MKILNTQVPDMAGPSEAGQASTVSVEGTLEVMRMLEKLSKRKAAVVPNRQARRKAEALARKAKKGKAT